jgi:hypothetical protein
VSKTGSRSDMMERIRLRLDAAEDKRPSVEAIKRALHRLCPWANVDGSSYGELSQVLKETMAETRL